MKVGIVGASGTLGRVMVDKLAAAGRFDIRCLLRRADEQIDRLADSVIAPAGVLDRDGIERVVADRDIVINLAARNPAGQTVDLRHLPDFLSANAVGPAFVADACREARTPLLHFSSVAVYETGRYEEGVPLDEGCFLPSLDTDTTAYYERALRRVRHAMDVGGRGSDGSSVSAMMEALLSADYPQETSVYGLSKLIGEQVVVESEAVSTCIRLSDVFGPGHESRGVVTDHLKAIASAVDSVGVDLDFRKTVYFIEMDDALTVALSLAERLVAGEPLPPIINVVGHCLDEPALTAALQSLASTTIGSELDFRVATETQIKFDRRYDVSLLKDVLPDFALSSLADGLARTWKAMAAGS